MTRAYAILIALLVPFWSAPAAAAVHSQADLESALTRLLAKPAGPYTYVIMDNPTSKKYVQFVVEDGHILIDLPLVQMSEAEQQKASAFFLKYGIKAPEEIDAPLTNGKTQHLQTYQPLLRSPQAAAKMAFRIFAEVFGLTGEFDSQITESD